MLPSLCVSSEWHSKQSDLYTQIHKILQLFSHQPTQYAQLQGKQIWQPACNHANSLPCVGSVCILYRFSWRTRFLALMVTMEQLLHWRYIEAEASSCSVT